MDSEIETIEPAMGCLNALAELTLDIGNPERSLRFYTDILGMSLLSTPDPGPGEESHWVVGFPRGAKLRLRYRRNASDPQAVYQPTDNDLYWKIGITLGNVDRAHERLVANNVEVSEPCQFHEIGYLCHLEDPDGYCIELLQHRFGKNMEPPSTSDESPLGREALIGQVSLNVAPIERALDVFQDQLGLRLLSRQVVPGRGFTLYFLADTADELPIADIDAIGNREWLWQRPYTLLELRSYNRPRSQSFIAGEHTLGFRGLQFSRTGDYLPNHLLFSDGRRASDPRDDAG